MCRGAEPNGVRIRIQEGQGAAVTPTNDDRIAYLAGEDGTSLPADELAALDVLRAELGTAAMWEEPPSALEDQVVMAVAQAAAAQRAAELGAAEPVAAPAPSPSLWSRLRGRLALRRPVFALSLGLSAGAFAAVAIVLVSNAGTTTPALQFAMVVQGTPL